MLREELDVSLEEALGQGLSQVDPGLLDQGDVLRRLALDRLIEVEG